MTGVHVDVVIHLLDIDPKFQENIKKYSQYPQECCQETADLIPN